MSILKIENFRAIKGAQIEVSDFLVVIGEQASGKSTISKLIHYFKSLKKDAVESLSEHQIDSEAAIIETQRKFIDKALKSFNLLFGSTKHEVFSIEYYYMDDKFIRIEQKAGGENKLQFHASWYSNEWYKIVKGYNNFLIKFGQESNGSFDSDNIVKIKRKREREKSEKESQDKINSLFGDTDRRRPYIPSSRSLISSLSSSSGRQNAIAFFSKTNSDSSTIDTSVTKYFDVTVGDFFYEIDRIKEDILKKKHLHELVEDADINIQKSLKSFYPLFIEILKADYRIVNEREELISEKFSKPVLLEFASSGQQEIVWILLCLFVWSYENYPSSVVIEEPEAHLYPKTQDLVLQYIAQFFNANPNNQVIINTHSPYLILALNNLLFAHQVNDDAIVEKTKIAKESWLNPERFGAYLIENGTVKSIFDKDEGLISESILEYEATAINEVFEKISTIYQPIN
jgi:predicted ATPase